MQPIRIGDLAFRGLLNLLDSAKPVKSDATWGAVDAFLDAEAKAHGFADWLDAFDNFHPQEETSNEETPFDQLTKERAIAIKALRAVERFAHAIHTDALAEVAERKDAEEVCTMAHNALDEIGDDRVSEL